MTNWILAARPKTLPAAVVPVWLGTILAWHDTGTVSAWLAASTLASVICIQIATNLFNDALDAQKGADTPQRLGPVRVTASGRLPVRVVLWAGLACCGAAALFGLPLIAARGPVILGIGVASLLLAYAYTGGPYPLAYRGLGELFVILFFGLVATLGSYFVQTGLVGGFTAWIVALQIGLLSSGLIAINNFRDVAEDATTGKRTLAVRWGAAFARWEITAFSLGPFFLGGLAWPIASVAVGLPWIAFPIAVLICWRVWKEEPSPKYNRYLALAGLQLLAFAILLSIALVAF